MEDKMRTKEEIQEACDFFSAILKFNNAQPEDNRMPQELYLKIRMNIDALSWVLGEKGADALPQNIATLKRVLRESGYTVVEQTVIEE